ncbi:MAG: GntR family transcriptional regulator [Eubacteriales bacterium]|nr:GntR family transcriptional regulator [Eubacteriales bacterium]
MGDHQFFLDKKLDKNVPIPLYFQLKELIISAIRDGQYKSGSMLPTEMELIEQFQVSRTTVRQAIIELVQEGWLYRVKSKGTFVSAPKIKQDFMQKLETFREQMERSGMTPGTEVLEFRIEEAASEIADALKITEGTKVIYLYRRRFANDEPILLAETYLPYDLCGFIMEHDFSKESLYEVLRETEDTEVLKIWRRVEAVGAVECDARYLNMKMGEPVQLFHSIGSNAFDRPIEYSVARYRGDRNSFEVTVYAEKKNGS